MIINLDLKKQLNKTKNYHINPLIKFKNGYDYMVRIHNEQTRLNDKTCINHPLHVLQNVLKYKK